MWPQPDGSLYVSAIVDLRRICARLNIPWSPDAESVTIGGLVTEQLGKLPEEGDRVQWRGFWLDVVSAGPRRAERIRISRIN
jgi:putative hemolysin